MIARDLLDTLISHREICVGMAANMIGKAVRIIVFIDGAKPSLMFNPEIISKSQFAQLTLLSEFTVELAL